MVDAAEGLGCRSWRFMYQLSGNGYTTVTDREDMQVRDWHVTITMTGKQNAFIAVRDSKGKLLDRDMGGVRIVFPGLYGGRGRKGISKPGGGRWGKMVVLVKEEEEEKAH